MLRRADDWVDGTQAMNDHLKAYQAEGDWALADAAAVCQRWIDIFNFDLNLKIGSPALMIGRLRGRCGHFRFGHNSFGLKNEIAIDIRHLSAGLESRTAWIDVLDTLCHECLHYWEYLHAGKKTGGRYHTQVFRNKAESVGLLVDQNGISLGVEFNSPFTDLLKKHGVAVPEIGLPERCPDSTSPTRLKLWTCRCDRPYKLRIARPHPRIRCDYCNSLFVKHERGVNS